MRLAPSHGSAAGSNTRHAPYYKEDVIIDIRRVGRDLTPPIIVQAYRRARFGPPGGLSGDYASWAEATAASIGYDSPSILEKTLAATLAVRAGRAEFEVDSVFYDSPRFAWPVLCGLLWVAARDGRLSVLDLGGALGSSYWRHRPVLDTLSDVTWSVVEQPAHVRVGSERLANERLHFFETISGCAEAEAPNVALLSGVLQYLEEPFAALAEVARQGIGHVVLDRTHFSGGQRDVLTVQEPAASVYEGSYPCWVFSREAFLKRVSGLGYDVVVEFEPEEVSGSGMAYAEGGMILESRVSGRPVRD